MSRPGKELTIIEGTSVSAAPFSLNDGVDVCFMEVDPTQVGPCLDISRLSASDLPAQHSYCIVGFPHKKGTINFTKRTVDAPPMLISGTPSPSAVYQSLGVLPPTHVLFDFDREKMRQGDKVVTAPVPKGMSGCGIWRLVEPSRLEIEQTLVGIFIEYKRPHKVLVGTRIAVILEMIRKTNPSLSSQIPFSLHVKIALSRV